MPVAATQNLFVGPRSISRNEHIFGRDEEIQRLTHLLLAERVVLLHSPSGAGKSSLIEAGLFRALIDETDDDFYILPTIKLGISASAAAPGPSVLSEAVIRSLEPAAPANGDSSRFVSIEEYLNLRAKKNADGKCICLVFDQFEECLTFLPGQEATKNAFFLDLGRALADPNVWALFAVREDFLAPIIDLGRVLPTRFKQTFRLDFLTKNKAKEVIQKTAKLGHYEFEPTALEQLVNDLAIVNVQRQDGTFNVEPGEYVEPLHLQVACQHLLHRLPEGKTKIERQDLKCPENGGPRPETSVDEALAAYYQNKLFGIAGNNKALQRDLRFWVEESLIDPSGIRVPIRQGAKSTEDLDNQTIDKLCDVYLVRKERRLNATWYELAHDRLVQPILLDNKEWFDQNLGPLGQGCRAWIKHGRDPHHLLNPRDLKKALADYKASFGWFSPDEIAFIRESTAEAKRRRRKALNRLVIPISVSLAVAGFFATRFFFERLKNEILTSYSSFSSLRGLYGAWTPGSLDRNVLFACHLVKELGQRKKAVDPLFYGDVVTVLDRALERRGRLVETDWNYERPATAADVGDRFSVSAVAYSPDGEALVLADSRARVRVLRNGVLSDPVTVAGGKIWSLAFSPDGSRVAAGTNSRFVRIVNLSDSSPAETIVQLGFPGNSDQTPVVWSCSWNEQGDLAAACQDGKVYVWLDLLHSLQSGTLLPSVVLENSGREELIPVHAVAWDDTGSQLAIGDGGGHLRLWNRVTLSEPIVAHSEAVWALAWSQDGRLACGSWDRSISIWKIEKSTEGESPFCIVRRPDAHDHRVRDVAWVSQDQFIASVGDDGMLKLFNSSDLSPLPNPEQSPTTELWRLSYSKSAKTIATANGDGAVRMYQLSSPWQDTHGNHLNDVLSLAFMDSAVLSFDLDGAIDSFDPVSRKEEPTQLPRDLQSGIKTVRFEPRFRAFVLGYDLSFKKRPPYGQLVVSDADQPLRFQQCPVPESVAYVACQPKQPIVAFLTRKGTLGLRTLPDLQSVPAQPDFQIIRDPEKLRVGKIAWSNAGDALLVVLNRNDENTCEILRFPFDGKVLADFAQVIPIRVPALITSVAWHPGDEFVALGTRGGAIVLQPLKSVTADPVKPVVGHDGTVNVLAWSSDGRRLFSGGDDRIVKVWACDLSAKDRLSSVTALRHATGAVFSIAVCPGDTGIYTAGTDPRIYYWPASRYSVDALLARARKMVNRNMFNGEWSRYAQSDASKKERYEKTFDDLPSLSKTESP